MRLGPSFARKPPACAAAANATARLNGGRRLLSAAATHAPTKTVDVSSVKGRHFDDLFSFTAAEIDSLLVLSQTLKEQLGQRRVVYQPLVRREG